VGENELWIVGARTTADESLTALALLLKMGAWVNVGDSEDETEVFSPVKKRGR
jgi:hypothetical protein